MPNKVRYLIQRALLGLNPKSHINNYLLMMSLVFFIYGLEKSLVDIYRSEINSLSIIGEKDRFPVTQYTKK